MAKHPALDENGKLPLRFLPDVSTPGVLTVTYANGVWPPRPTDDPGVTVLWIGGSPEEPPPGRVSGVDLWLVPDIAVGE